MKILKYLIFFSILSGIFFVIYRQSDKKGFGRVWISFKMAALIAAIVAGLIPNSVEAIEPDVPNNSTSVEIVLSNQELDSLDDPNSRVDLVKTGDSSPSAPTLPGRGQPNNFPSGTTGGRRTPHVNPYLKPPKLIDQGLGAGANPAGAGGAGEFDDDNSSPKKKQSQESKTFDSDHRFNDRKKKSEKQCPISEQKKANIEELPDSSKYIYNLETKTAKQAIKNVWKNPQARQEVLDGLARMDKGELLPRHQKNFKGFKDLKEIKLNDTRMLVKPGKKGAPDEIVIICMRRDLDSVARKLKPKYK